MNARGPSPEIAARNAELTADYLAGLTAGQLARKYRLKPNYVRVLLYRLGVTLPHGERVKRWRPPTGVINPGGRLGAWRDCPPELRDDYRNLRRKGYRADEARALLERHAA